VVATVAIINAVATITITTTAAMATTTTIVVIVIIIVKSQKSTFLVNITSAAPVG